MIVFWFILGLVVLACVPVGELIESKRTRRVREEEARNAYLDRAAARERAEAERMARHAAAYEAGVARWRARK